MDEPFASVDAQTRGDLEDLVLQVRQQFGVTVLFVTHDIDESVYLADRIVVLTPSPTEVREVIDVDLPRPRDQVETKELPEFARLRAHVYRLIKRRSGRRQQDRPGTRVDGERTPMHRVIEDRGSARRRPRCSPRAAATTARAAAAAGAAATRSRSRRRSRSG